MSQSTPIPSDAVSAPTANPARALGPWRVDHQPGDWVVLTGPSAVVLLQPTDAGTGILTRAWELVLDASGPHDLVRRLGDIGLDVLPNLAVVFRDTAGLHALLRGDTAVEDAGGQRLGSGSGARTWREADLNADCVDLVHSRSAHRDESQALPLLVGAARADRVRIDITAGAVPAVATGTWQAEAPVTQTEPTESEPTESEPHLHAVPAEVAGGDFFDGDFSAEVEDGEVGTEDMEVEDVEVEDTEAFGIEDDPAQGDDPAHQDADEQDAPQPDEGERSRTEAAQDSASAVVAGEPVVNGLGAGAGAAAGAGVPVAVPAAPSHAPEDDATDDQAARRPVLAELRANTGDSVLVSGQVVIGRAPSVERFDANAVAMRVPSPGHDISRTHVLVLPDNNQLYVVDLDSTNGTVLGTPDGEPVDLEPGVPVRLPVGSVIDLGDEITIEVLAAPEGR